MSKSSRCARVLLPLNLADSSPHELLNRLYCMRVVTTAGVLQPVAFEKAPSTFYREVKNMYEARLKDCESKKRENDRALGRMQVRPGFAARSLAEESARNTRNAIPTVVLGVT